MLSSALRRAASKAQTRNVVSASRRWAQPQGSHPANSVAAVSYDDPSTELTLSNDYFGSFESLSQPKISVVGVGGAGSNAVNNMINSSLEGVEFVAANTDAQALKLSLASHKVQLGHMTTHGLGAGARPDIGKIAAEESHDELMNIIGDSNMVFVTAGMGGGTGTGAAPFIAQACKEKNILTVGVVSLPFNFEGRHRSKLAEYGLAEMERAVDTLIVIPNQNLFSIAGPETTFASAFKMADDVLLSGVQSVTNLIVLPGLINLDFADVRAVMRGMGRALMGTGMAKGENRAQEAADLALANPLLGLDVNIEGGQGVLISIAGGDDLTLFEVDQIANTVRDKVHPDANIIFGSTFDNSLDGAIRVSLIVTGLPVEADTTPTHIHTRPAARRTVQKTGATLNAETMRESKTVDAEVISPEGSNARTGTKKSFWARNW